MLKSLDVVEDKRGASSLREPRDSALEIDPLQSAV
jgi:hypothetical protein